MDNIPIFYAGKYQYKIHWMKINEEKFHRRNNLDIKLG